MHILCWRGVPIAAAERLERLSEQMTLYTPEQQADMTVANVEVLE